MTQRSITIHASKADLIAALHTIPKEAKANGATARDMLARAGLILLKHISDAFKVKMRGGTDECGERWKPLAPKTIAYSRRPGLNRNPSLKGRGRRKTTSSDKPSSALSVKQRSRWWDLYRQGLAIYNGNKAAAAKRAWIISKKEGARTLLDKYGNTKVDILNKTGALLDSLSPDTDSPYRVIEPYAGGVRVGTTRPGAMAHHKGVSKKNLPRRRLWPPVNKWPASWWQDMVEEVKQGIVEIAVRLARGQR